jgi:acetolactate synthase-1/2/3 large subunit
MAVLEGSALVGDRLLEMLRAWGVEYVFSSPGSDWPPLWEALAKAQAQGQPSPRLLTCRHEQLAVCLAIGYHRATRRLPVVVLHTGVGALHTAMVLRSAFQERIPMLVIVGEPTVFGEDPDRDIGAQWLRTLADVGGPHRLVAPYVKWSGHAPDPTTLGQVLQHAADVALEPPGGPAFVAVPVEDLAGVESAPIRVSALSPRREAWPAPEEVSRAAAALLGAERPLIITETAGRDPANVARLVALAEALAAPVVEAQTPAYLNFPRNHRLHQGYAAAPLAADADVVLLAGCTVPWHPASRWPRPGASVIALSDDPAQDLLPIAGYRVDMRLSGSVSTGLQRLAEEVAAGVSSLRPDRAQRIAVRRASLEERHLRQRAEWDQLAREAADARPIDSSWLAYALNRVLPEDAVLVEETTTDKQALLRLVPRTAPGTYHVRSTGGLGVMLGVAQGLKLAMPERLVVAVIGDGAFHYSPGLANFGFAQQYGHPLLVILSDNGAYVSMRSGHDRMYPEGWAVQTGVHPGTEIEPRPDYPALARAYGGYAERVEDPHDVPGALDRALERVRGGQWAFLDVITGGEDTRPPR